MLNEKDKIELIHYRINQAMDTINVVRVLIQNNMYAAAINRIYYGIFYILLALGLLYDFETSKHQQLIGWFNKEFIKEGRIEKEYGRIVRQAYESRTSTDYDSFIEITEEEVHALFNQMQKFISEVNTFINKEIEKNIS